MYTQTHVENELKDMINVDKKLVYFDGQGSLRKAGMADFLINKCGYKWADEVKEVKNNGV